jgi:hypothetical protein
MPIQYKAIALAISIVDKQLLHMYHIVRLYAILWCLLPTYINLSFIEGHGRVILELNRGEWSAIHTSHITL